MTSDVSAIASSLCEAIKYLGKVSEDVTLSLDFQTFQTFIPTILFYRKFFTICLYRNSSSTKILSLFGLMSKNPKE